MATTFIYALCEPGTRTVRYIGKTVRPKKRLVEHVRYSSKQNTYLGNWIRGLVACGKVPNMVILRGVPAEEADAAEIQYIRTARESLGMRLVNATDGGDGITMTPEICKKISAAMTGEGNHRFGVSPTEESRARQSAALTGRKQTPEQVAALTARMRSDENPLLGKPQSEETKAKRVAAWTPEKRAARSQKETGLKRPPEWGAAISKGNKGRVFTPEHCAALSAAATARYAKGKS